MKWYFTDLERTNLKESKIGQGVQRMIDLADYIPVGHDNAVTTDELQRRTGLDNRSLRAAIKASSVLICNLQDGSGYFVPAPEDADYVRRYMAQERSRMMEIGNTRRRCAKWLRAHLSPSEAREMSKGE